MYFNCTWMLSQFRVYFVRIVLSYMVFAVDSMRSTVLFNVITSVSLNMQQLVKVLLHELCSRFLSNSQPIMCLCNAELCCHSYSDYTNHSSWNPMVWYRNLFRTLWKYSNWKEHLDTIWNQMIIKQFSTELKYTGIY